MLSAHTLERVDGTMIKHSGDLTRGGKAKEVGQ
jgi:hypothetical protein